MKIGGLSMFMYLPILALLIGLGVVFLSEDKFRYGCQDPANWGTTECSPPICKASGMCTEDLVNLENSTINEIITENAVEDIIEQEETIDATVSEEVQDYSCDSICNNTEEEIDGQ